MEIKLMLYSRDGTKGIDYSQNVRNITYTTSQKGSAGTFNVDIIDIDEEVKVGWQIECIINNTNFFKGYIFKISKDKLNNGSLVAYDQLRYLKTNHSYAFNGMSADEIVKKISNDFLLNVGNINPIPYKIPSLICEDTSLFDIIDEALTITLNNTGLIYVMYDDFGKITLKQCSELQKDIIIGDTSNLVNYNYVLDIDKETYNQIRLVKENKNTGKAEVVIVNDTSTIQEWGLLQLYAKVDEESNEAQIKESAETRLKYYNRVLETIELQNVIGDETIRAGVMIPIQINKISKFQSPYWLIAKQVIHNIRGNNYTMNITCDILSNVFYK